MSSLITKTIEPVTGTTVTLGAGGDTVLVSANQLKTNTVKDAGGNTIFTSDGAGTLSSVNSSLKGGMIFISSQTVSGASSISFTTGIDSTYDEYVFYCVDMYLDTQGESLTINFSSDGGSNYNMIKTTTYFEAWHQEADTGAGLGYELGHDLQQSTSYQRLATDQSDAADHVSAVELHLFAPSSTTYAKQFYSVGNWVGGNEDSNINRSSNGFVGGYVNTTVAINAVDFKPSGGTFTGTIYLYGMK